MAITFCRLISTFTRLGIKPHLLFKAFLCQFALLRAPSVSFLKIQLHSNMCTEQDLQLRSWNSSHFFLWTVTTRMANIGFRELLIQYEIFWAYIQVCSAYPFISETQIMLQKLNHRLFKYPMRQQNQWVDRHLPFIYHICILFSLSPPLPFPKETQNYCIIPQPCIIS